MKPFDVPDLTKAADAELLQTLRGGNVRLVQAAQRQIADRNVKSLAPELKKLAGELQVSGTTLVPLSLYFKNGMAKVEIGIAHGKQRHDKRQSIKKKEQDREMRRAMTQRR